MIEAAFVTLREAAELLLIGQALLLAATTTGRASLRRACVWGTGLGAVAGVLGAAWVLAHPAREDLAAWISLAFLAVVVALASSLLSSSRLIHERAQDLIDRWAHHDAAPGLMLGVASVVGVREAMETGLLLAAVDPDFGPRTWAGVALGLAGAGLLLATYGRFRDRVNLASLFRWSAVALVLIAVESMIGIVADLLRRHGDVDSPWMKSLEQILPGGSGYDW
ncbi:hypothetical protein, partial [Roseateles sp.]|uniref:hypothetical protein n=1 Tax=Roseateles sp. TaxID=1971397 RepID=UPI002F427A52